MNGSTGSSDHPVGKVAFEITFWRLQEQVARDAALNAKLGGTFALSAAMIALLGSALLFGGQETPERVDGVVLAAIALFAANIVVSASAYLIGRWTLAPSVNDLLEYSRIWDEEELTRWATAAMVDAVNRNERSLRVKDALVGAATVLTAATALAIAIAVLFATI